MVLIKNEYTPNIFTIVPVTIKKVTSTKDKNIYIDTANLNNKTTKSKNRQTFSTNEIKIVEKNNTISTTFYYIDIVS